MKIPGIVIAASASGSGKTAVTMAMMKAFQNAGKKVRACKCGPDYIDPMFHRKVLGIDSENLDLYFCDRERLRERFCHHAEGADLVVTEGVMGYYDGISLISDQASTYDVARTLGLPVILVVPARGMASTILAVLKGMIEYRDDSNIQGIILNRISPMLYPKMKKMIEEGLMEMGHPVQVAGFVPEEEAFHLDSRHLGLMLPEEIGNLGDQIDRAAEILAETLDMELILKIAGEAGESLSGYSDKRNEKVDKNCFFTVRDKDQEWNPDKIKRKENRQKKIRIGVAHDRAFCFYYKDNMELLKELGCELVPFSPLEDTGLPEGLDGLLFGGGYPELCAKELAENESMRKSVHERIGKGIPCIAECGGFLYLTEELEGEDGTSYPMAGVLSGKGIKKGRLTRFGYIELTAQKDGAYLKKGEKIRAHEFHYWDSTENGEDTLAVKPDGVRKWQAVHMKENLFAGFPHLYFYSNPKVAERFVAACRTYGSK